MKAPPIPKPSRARATRAQMTRSEMDRQVVAVVEVMARGMWGDEAAEQFVEQWGIARASVDERAAQASRFLRLLLSQSPEEVAALKAWWMSTLAGIQMQGEDRDRIGAIRLSAELAGVITKGGGRETTEASPDLMALPVAQRRAKLREAAEAISKALAECEAEAGNGGVEREAVAGVAKGVGAGGEGAMVKR